MWNLNDSPDHRPEEESEDHRVGSVSNSSSSAVVIEDGSEEEYGGKKRSSKIFELSLANNCLPESQSLVTRQFFPMDHSQMGSPKAYWTDAKFGVSALLNSSVTGKPTDVPQPLKKSRRGPRSRSSQYRGVTFYRRTGRWESHIWLVFFSLRKNRFILLVVFNQLYMFFNFSGIVESKFIWVCFILFYFSVDFNFYINF